mgnify:CR=1 FL=1
MKLTKAFAARQNKPGIYRDDKVKGFCLRVYPSKNKCWFFKQNPHGAFVIGKIDEISAEKARSIAADVKEQIRAGSSPLKKKSGRRRFQKKVSGTAVTLSNAWADFEKAVLIKGTRKLDNRPYSESHKRNAARSMRLHVLPIFGHRHPSKISKQEWLLLRDKHATNRAAEWRQIRAYITSCYKWMMETSPYMDHVHGLPYFGTVPKSVVRTRQLRTIDEIRTIWDCAETITPKQAGLAVRFLLLSNRRIGEVRQMKIDQIEFDRLLWHIPSIATKSRIQCCQALSPLMCQLIKQAINERDDGYVFLIHRGYLVCF